MRNSHNNIVEDINCSPVNDTASILRSVADSIAGCCADEYFRALASSLSKTLGMDFVLIGQLTGGGAKHIQTKAAARNGELLDDFTYDISGTPCEEVAANNKFCLYKTGIQACFPKDLLLQEMEIEGYFGSPLISSTGKTLGLIVALSKSPIQNSDDMAACFDMVVARTASEMERLITEEHIAKLSQVVEQSPVSVVITDTKGRIEYVNEYFEAVTGFSRDEVTGENPSLLKSGVTSDKEYKRLWETLSKGDVWAGEFHNKRKDGSQFWERARIGPLRNTSNEVIGYIAIKEDISQQKENEKELRLAATVFNTAAEAVMVSDANNKIVKVNEAFCKITGYVSEEILGENPSILQSGHHDKCYYDAIYAALQTTGTWSGEIWNRRKNGEAYPEWLAISVMLDSNGDIEGYVSLFSDITKRKQDEARIQHQANFDSLTGLPNRRLFSDRFSRAIEHGKNCRQRVGVIFIDLDRFKHINDLLGHSVGDELLQQVSERLIKCIGSSDTAARFGGDEFAILLTDSPDLHNIEDKVISLLDCICKPYCLRGADAYVSASIGVSVYPDDGKSTETLLRKADSAMYKAKDKGRSNFQFFTHEMDVEAKQRRELEGALRNALEKKELSLRFQPIVDLDEGVTRNAEALLRWTHPEKGPISPEEFIPLAEEIGLIVPIGEWVLREACKEAVAWSKVTEKPPGISVNVSSVQFQRQDLPGLVETVLAETGLPPGRLTLEMTESLLVSDDDETLQQLYRIRRMGVELSIDDFGTGYSSLSYLKKFPITCLKIDRSFITGLPTDPENIVLVDAILSMARSLNLKVVAEGVETESQMNFLKDSHCQYVQGYLYSRPLLQADFISYLKQPTK